MYVLHLTNLNIYSFFLAVSSLDLAACVAVNVHVLFSLNTVNSNVQSIELSLHIVWVFGSSQYIVRNNYMGTMLYFEITIMLNYLLCLSVNTDRLSQKYIRKLQLENMTLCYKIVYALKFVDSITSGQCDI